MSIFDLGPLGIWIVLGFLAFLLVVL